MIDLQLLKTGGFPDDYSIEEIRELIEAVEEAKEIIEIAVATTDRQITFDEGSQWLSRYFQTKKAED